MAKSIEIIINADGTLNIDAIGFKGADCEKAAAFLEKALGQVSGRNKKPEYHCGVTGKNQQRIGS